MTTTTSGLQRSPYSYARDPSGVELRRALRVHPQAARPPATHELVLALGAALTLVAGVLRVALGS